jgi:hypothetical protein
MGFVMTPLSLRDRCEWIFATARETEMNESTLTWEAFRLTSKSPSELMHVLGPHGVDHLIRQGLATCWRELPAEDKTLAAAKRAAQEAFDRNARHWAKIKRPDPAAFFDDLAPHAADGFFRQALVLCHMMLPRGKRPLGDVLKVFTAIYQRNLDAWDSDHTVFTKGIGKSKKSAKKAKAIKKKPKKKQ